MSTLTGNVSFISIWAYKVSKALSEFKTSLEHQSQIRSTIKELSALSDAELRDIGIARGDIWEIAHGANTRRYDLQKNIVADRNDNLKGWV